MVGDLFKKAQKVKMFLGLSQPCIWVIKQDSARRKIVEDSMLRHRRSLKLRKIGVITSIFSE
jgi:hypothetical protein